MRQSEAAASVRRSALDPYALGVGLWIFISLLLPDEKLSLGMLGGSPGSTSTGANFYYAELGAMILAAWALALPDLRARIPRLARRAAVCWCLIMGFSAAKGLAQGYAVRNVLSDARVALLAPALLALGALDAPGRRLAWKCLFAGALGYALTQAVLIALLPTGLCNLSIVPVPIAASEHSSQHQWLSAVVVVLAGGLWCPWLPGLALASGAWILLWLSLIRGLWVAVLFGCAAVALFLVGGGRRRWALRFTVIQVFACALGLLGSLAIYRATTPDGLFLIKFRIQRLAQDLHFTAPPPMKPEVGARGSAYLRSVVQKGGLYGTQRDRALDPSLGQRELEVKAFLAPFRQSPFLGGGLGLTLPVPEVSQVKHLRLRREPENDAAWFLSKTGLLGAAFFAGALVWTAWSLWSRRSLAGPVEAAALAVLVMALVLEPLQCGILSPTVWLPVMVLASVLLRPPEGA